jgi:GNAT superfamily N-acetyltransferase
MDGGNKRFKYMQLDSDMRKDYDQSDIINNLKQVYFFGLEVNDIIVALAHIRRSPYIENTYWLSYLCVDPDYEGAGYASQLSEYIFKWFRERNLQFETSSYTEDGFVKLKPLFNKLATKYGVPFIDKGKF